MRPSPDRIYLISTALDDPGYAATDNRLMADILTATGGYREATREEWLAERDRVREVSGTLYEAGEEEEI